jgi:hypothetical protein
MKWQDLTDEQLFETGGEQPGSQRSYERELEIRRRSYLLEKRVAEAQIGAANSQQLAANATVRTASWTMYSALAVAVSVVVAVVGLLM